MIDCTAVIELFGYDQHVKNFKDMRSESLSISLKFNIDSHLECKVKTKSKNL